MNTCETCDGSGVVCTVCGGDIGCDCDDRDDVECPECRGAGEVENDEDMEESDETE